MKMGILALLLLLVMLLCILCNALYINKVAIEMEKQLAALSVPAEENTEEAIDALLAYWERQLPYLGLSVGFPLLDRIGEQLRLLRACAEEGDVFGYTEALTLLLDCMHDLCRLERFALENLL